MEKFAVRKSFQMRHKLISLIALLAFCSVANIQEAQAQLFGDEANNTLMPASGGMAGTSIAEPQDLTSAINGNPASLTQFQDTQFLFGVAWAEPTFHLTQSKQIPGLVDPFSAKSSGVGMLAGNIGVTQEFTLMERPATFGLGFVSTTGGNFDFRHVDESKGTDTSAVIVNLPVTVGVDLTDRVSVGAGMSLGVAMFDPPFFGAMSIAYGLRGTVGANYKLTEQTTLGAYYQTEQAFKFNNIIVIDNLPPPFDGGHDLDMEMPQNIGFGLANRSFAGGRLLLAVDVLLKVWDEAEMYRGFYDDQWVIQLGAQYSTGRYRLRAGYAWAENPLDPTPDVVVGGFELPGDVPFVRYNQALVANTSQHRLTVGIGISDILPGVDFDIMAGGMFRDSEQLGASTATSISSYWIGAGLTWRFGSSS